MAAVFLAVSVLLPEKPRLEPAPWCRPADAYGGILWSMVYISVEYCTNNKGDIQSNPVWWPVLPHKTPLAGQRNECFSITQSCPTLCDPMDCNTPGFLVFRYLPEFTQRNEWGVCKSNTLGDLFHWKPLFAKGLERRCGPQEPVGPRSPWSASALSPLTLGCLTMWSWPCTEWGRWSVKMLVPLPPSGLPAVPEALLLLPSWKKSQNFASKKKKLEKRNTNSKCARLLRGSRIEIQPQKSHGHRENPNFCLNPTWNICLPGFLLSQASF